ncbi:TolC family protein [bacterium]|nr:TolC family protein [bacterium]
MSRVRAAAVFALLLGLSGFAGAYAQEIRILSIQDALKLALDRNPTFAKANLSHESARLTYLKTLHGLGWVETFSSKMDFKRDETGSYSRYSTATGEVYSFTRAKTLSSNTAWDFKRTFASGVDADFYTKLNSSGVRNKYKKIGQPTSLLEQTAGGDVTRYQYLTEKINPEVGLNLTIPFYGPDKDKGRLSRQTADMIWEQSRLDFEMARKTLVFSVRQGYYDLLKAREMTRLRKDSLAEGEVRLELARKRLGVGMVTDLDVSQAELAVLRNRADLADATFSEQQAFSGFNSLIGLPLDDYYDLTESFPADDGEELSIKAIQTRVVSASDELKRANKDVDLASVSVEEARGKLKPSFAFTSTLAMEGERRSVPRVLRDPEEKYAFGLVYDFPFGKKVTEQADLELAKADLSTKVLVRDELSQGLLLDATQNYQELLKVRRRLAIARQSSEVAARRLEISQAKYDAGRAEITDVISAKEALVSARVEELNNLYSVAVALAQLELLTGGSL